VTVFDPAAVGGSGMRIGDATVLMGTAFEGDAAQAIEVTGDASLEGLARTQSFVQNGAMTAAAGDSLALRTIDFTLQGDASAFLGTLEVEGASFTMVNGSIGGDVEVRGGSLFDATGNVAGGLDIRGSTLRTTGGDPLVPARLDVAGDLSLDGASTMVANVFLDLEAPGSTVRQSDRVVVAGDAAKSGHLTAFWNQQNTPAGDLIPDRGQSRSWTVLTSAGGSGSFTSAELDVFDPHTGDVTSIVLPINASESGALVRYTTVFNATEATITLTGIAALPPDQVFDTICGPITGAQIDEIINELIRVEDNGTADASLVAALILLQDAEAIEPSYVATQQRNPYAAPDVVLDSNAMAGRVAMLRLMQVRDGELGSAASKAADTNGTRATDVAAASQRGFGAPLNGPTPDEGARPWMRGYGFYEDVDEQDCAECGYDAAIGAAMVGIDWTVDGGGIVGAFAGLGPGQITLTGPYGGQVEDLVQVLAGVYGSVVPGDGAAYLQGFALGAYGDIDRTRNVEIPTVQRAATSGNESWSLTVGGEVGLNLEVSERTVLQPFAGVAWGQYWGEGYTETGAGSLNLTVQDQSANEWLPTAGARLMHAFREGSDVLTPFIGAAFVAQLPVGAGWAPTYTSDFALGEQQQLLSGPPDRYGVSFQAGLELAKVNGVTAYAAFDGAVLTGKQRFGGQVGVLVPF
jgi:outer membrane autotransporter protein